MIAWEFTSTLIGKKLIVYCTGKTLENWSLFYSNRPHFLPVYQRNNHAEC